MVATNATLYHSFGCNRYGHSNERGRSAQIEPIAGVTSHEATATVIPQYRPL